MAHQQVYKRSLATAGRTDNGNFLTGRYAKIHILQQWLIFGNPADNITLRKSVQVG